MEESRIWSGKCEGRKTDHCGLFILSEKINQAAGENEGRCGEFKEDKGEKKEEEK